MTFVQVLVNGVVLGAFFALMAVGLTLIFGVLRVINFTHGVMFMLGAYGTWYATEQGVPYLVAVLVSALAVAAFSALVELLVLRRFRGMLIEGAVVAIALAVLIQNLANEVIPLSPKSVDTPFPGTVSMHGVVLGWHRIFLFGMACVLIFGLALFVRRSRTGRAMRALQQNPYAAELQGIRADFVAPAVFAIGGGLAALAGGLIAPVQQLLPGIGDAPLLASFVVVVLGGLGSIGGTLVAAMMIGLTQSAATTYWTGPAAVALSFLLAIAVLVVRPKGLFGNE
ncbi:MAG: transporter permease [Conexibacter sp.]|nr:transporter permease [Conexibacter sp.]